jgi:glucose/arabinose dehydrogenase
LFIAERAGAIRIVRHGRAEIASAMRLDEVSTTGGNGLLAIAIDPQFSRTHFVYVIYTAASRSGDPVFRVARFREVRDLLGEEAVLLDGVPAGPTRATAALRFGPDGKLYAAFDAAGDRRRLTDPASYNGKILRLNGDGTTPSDQPAQSPVYGPGDEEPIGLDWHPETGALWIAGRGGQEPARLRVAGQREIGPLTDPQAIAFYHGALFPSLRGNLLVAGGVEPTIMRLTFDEGSRHIIARESLLENVRGVISTLVVSPDGAIYFCVNDELIRLVRSPL